MPDRLTPIDIRLPHDAAYMARTEISRVRRLGLQPANLDTITGHLLGVLGRRPSVRHQSCVTDEILAFLDQAGLQIEEDLRVYRDADEAERHADELIAAGFRLLNPYPLREGRFAAAAHLVPADLWHRLNSKRYLDALVPREHLAPRRMLRDGGAAPPPAGGVYLKFAGEEATGMGHCVRYCPDATSFATALAWFQAEGCTDDLLVEQAIETDATWCANIAVTPQRCLFLGAAEQIRAAPGRQSGSIIDPDVRLPDTGIRLAVRIGEAARAHGFVGLAGLDMGRARDGNMIVFDPNFRFNACTGQILLHRAAVRRAPSMPISLSVNLHCALTIPALIRRLAGPVHDGWLVPTRLIDGRLLAHNAPTATCTGFVLGASRQAAAANVECLRRLIGAE